MKWLVASWVVLGACGTTGEVVDYEAGKAWLEERTDVRVTVLPLAQEEREAMFGSWWPDAVPWTRWRITVETRALPEGAVVSFSGPTHFQGTSEFDYREAEGASHANDHRVDDPGDEPKRQDYEAITVSPRRPSAGQTGGGWEIVGAVTLGLVGPRDPDEGLTKKQAAELQEHLRAQARERDDKRIAEWRVAKARYESYARTKAMIEAVQGCDVRDTYVMLEVGKTCTWISDGSWRHRTHGSWRATTDGPHEVVVSIHFDRLAKAPGFLMARIPLDDRDVEEQLRSHGPIVLGRAR